MAIGLRADGVTAPAQILLDELAAGSWEDPGAEVLPDEYQVHLRRRLIALVEQLANEGEIWPESARNSLGDGIWEFKVEGVRLTFFDTDGVGGWVPKLGEQESTWDGGTRWVLPNFDEHVRLGHAFPKVSQRTLQNDIDESRLVRQEDVSHDR